MVVVAVAAEGVMVPLATTPTVAVSGCLAGAVVKSRLWLAVTGAAITTRTATRWTRMGTVVAVALAAATVVVTVAAAIATAPIKMAVKVAVKAAVKATAKAAVKAVRGTPSGPT